MSECRELVDLHCHLMPYVDDGAYDLDECRELLRSEVLQGVRTICLTPHLRADMFESTDEEIDSHFQQVLELVREEQLPLQLSCSREYHFDRIFRKRLEEGILRPLGRGRTLLVEFGGRDGGEEILEAIALVRRAGFLPLVAHAERYLPLHEDWAFAYELRDSGALVQVNAGSILGREGVRQRLLCRKLLKKGLVSAVASDAHDCQLRKPELELCFRQLETKYGRGTALRLLSGNPRAILDGKTVRTGE